MGVAGGCRSVLQVEVEVDAKCGEAREVPDDQIIETGMQQMGKTMNGSKSKMPDGAVEVAREPDH